MDVYGYMKRAFEETVGSETRGSREVQRLEARIAGLENKVVGLQVKIEATDARVNIVQGEIMSLKNELLAEIRRLDARFDGVARELRTAIEVRERLAGLEARQRS